MLDTAVNPLLCIENFANCILKDYASNTPGESHGVSERAQLRLNKKIKQGDLCVYVPSFRECDNHEKVASDYATILTTEPPLKEYIHSFKISKQGYINLKLKRSNVFRDIIKNVMNNREKYGQIAIEEKSILVPTEMGISYLNCGCYGTKEKLSLDDLRTRLLTEHLSEVINVCQRNQTTFFSDLKTLTEGADILLRSPLSVSEDLQSKESSSSSRANTLGKCLSEIKQCPYVMWKEEKTECCSAKKEELSMNKTMKQECASYGPSLNDDSTQGYFEFEKYFADDKSLEVGLDKNLIKSKVALNETLLSSLSIMEKCAQKQAKYGNERLIHICSSKNQFTTQQSTLVWRAMSGNALAENQFYVCHGPVTYHDGGTRIQRKLNACDFLRLRQDQLTQSYLVKYGDIVKGPRWEDSIKQITTATTKLEILSTSLKNMVKLDLSDISQDFREATFVMYNCARLSTLLQHFKQNVEKGLYPPLPSVEQVDFSLLKDQVEWELFVRYIMSYPSVVKEVADSLYKTHGLHINANTNRITVFLLKLSHEFSSYYGRVHILGESKTHLFPVMYARLYLMKALQQVFHSCLKLLNIAPLTQM